MRAIIYVRVSTDAQERDGTSLDTQVRACAEYAAAAGWSVVATIRDSASGFSLERPGIERVRQALRAGECDVVLSYAVDRLSRHQNHIGVLFDEAEGWGVRFEFVTERFEDTAIGRFILAARAFTGEVEREKIAERTMRGKAERARSGKIPQATGKGIYGYRYDPATGRREVNAVQTSVVRRVFDAFCAGAGCSRIAGELNRDAVPAMGGGFWHPLTVRRVLMNETYTGRTVYRRTKVTSVRDPRTGKKRRRVTTRDEAEWIEVEDATPAIVRRSTWESAQSLLNAPERQLRGKPMHDYRLRGHVRCMACGTPMVGQSMQQGRYRYYRCRRSFSGGFEGKCDSTYVRGEALEDAVRQEISRVLADPDVILRQASAQRMSEAVVDLDGEAERQLAEVIEQQKRLARLFVSGGLPEEVLQSESARLAEERNRLEGLLRLGRAVTPVANPAAPSLTDVFEAVGLLRQWLASAPDEDFRLMLQALDVTVTAAPDRAEITGSIPALRPSPDSICQDDILTIVQTSASASAGAKPGSPVGSEPSMTAPALSA